MSLLGTVVCQRWEFGDDPRTDKANCLGQTGIPEAGQNCRCIRADRIRDPRRAQRQVLTLCGGLRNAACEGMSLP